MSLRPPTRKAIYAIVAAVGALLVAYKVVEGPEWEVISQVVLSILALTLAMFNVPNEDEPDSPTGRHYRTPTAQEAVDPFRSEDNQR